MMSKPGSGLLRRKMEAFLVRVALYILRERNLSRAGVTSRHDNNTLWAASECLDNIARNISTGYAKVGDQ